ncbi:BRO-N domain-containing protein [Mannheimia pernigra]|uniref:BRO-N domain-containing protein n=1 Tax=Mannheimia pernigra TaxID=111844 RepID=UPI001317E88F|nr:BRO family protein [Mannheimia pernigra]QHB17902.1 hypothetical protein GM695_07625 [Mannheimia pernigra]
MSNIQIFNFNSNPVRIEFFEDQPHFCLLDVCNVFEIQNSRRVQREMLDMQGVRKAYILAKDEKKRKTSFINEPNLYRIIFRSEKPIAKEFQNWVFEEVLPQIRKTGQYSQTLPEKQPLEEQAKSLKVIMDLYAFGTQAFEMAHQLQRSPLANSINQQIGGHYLHNLQYPLKNALDRAKTFIQADNERIMFVKGALSLLEK